MQERMFYDNEAAPLWHGFDEKRVPACLGTWLTGRRKTYCINGTTHLLHASRICRAKGDRGSKGKKSWQWEDVKKG